MTHIYMLLERVTKNGEIMNRLIDSVHYSIRIGMADGQSWMTEYGAKRIVINRDCR